MIKTGLLIFLVVIMVVSSCMFKLMFKTLEKTAFSLEIQKGGETESGFPGEKENLGLIPWETPF